MRKLLGPLICMTFLIAAVTPTVLLAAPEQNCRESVSLSPDIRESINNNNDVWKLEECNSVRHIQSNTLCEPSIGPGWPLHRLIIFPSDPVIPRGNDIGCDYVVPNGGALTIYITHFDRSPDIEESFSGIQAAIISRFPDARPLQFSSASTDTIKPLTALYEIEIGEKQFRTGAWYGRIQGWDVKIRATFSADPEPEANIIQMTSSFQWLLKATALNINESE